MLLMVAGEKGGVLPLPAWLMRILNLIINLLRSIPFLILMIMVLPVSRAIIGTAVGTTATVVPLVAAAFPNRARLNKLHSFLSEQQSAVTNISRQIDARGALIGKLSAQCHELERRLELEVSEFGTMEKDEECTAAEMTESRRSMEGLLDQINSVRKELSDAMAYLEKASAEYKETYTKAGRAKKEYDAVRAACEAEAQEAKPEREKAAAEAANLRALVDPALLKRYDAIHANHARPMATVENSQCSGCRMSLPTAIVKKVASGSGIVECENCGRILYSK